ncbi:MAG TPA: DUF1385 domain-containing protein [Acidimicrobiales bacterium]|jgi:uncharacterized protein YqhQ|nr:DUF1385 domain-containing protein [Acidimicrobiales bacterium]
MGNEATIRAYGGQAVLGGVLMRGASTWAVAVRKPDGAIATTTGTVPVWGARWRKVPVVRGVIGLVESLRLGAKAIEWSAGQAEIGGPAAVASGPPGIVERAFTWIGVAVVLAFFFVVPGVAAGRLPGSGSGMGLSLIEGVIRISLLIGYIAALGLVPDLRRLYEYHGAEHKAITALEAGADLTPESVNRFTTRHPRCGTTFLLVVMVVAVAVHPLVGRPALPVLILSRLALVPVVAGLSYEVIKWAAARIERPWVARLMAPGLALQRLTTRPPSLPQVEVALAALQLVLAADDQAGVADAA